MILYVFKNLCKRIFQRTLQIIYMFYKYVATGVLPIWVSYIKEFNILLTFCFVIVLFEVH